MKTAAAENLMWTAIFNQYGASPPGYPAPLYPQQGAFGKKKGISLFIASKGDIIFYNVRDITPFLDIVLLMNSIRLSLPVYDEVPVTNCDK